VVAREGGAANTNTGTKHRTEPKHREYRNAPTPELVRQHCGTTRGLHAGVALLPTGVAAGVATQARWAAPTSHQPGSGLLDRTTPMSSSIGPPYQPPPAIQRPCQPPCHGGPHSKTRPGNATSPQHPTPTEHSNMAQRHVGPHATKAGRNTRTTANPAQDC
jgi:hypothetical protein